MTRLAALWMYEDVSIEILPIPHWTFTCFSKDGHKSTQTRGLRKAFSSLKHPSRCSYSPLICGSPLSSLLCCGRTAPEVSEEEGSYASRFYRWFLEIFKSCLLLLVALPGLIDTRAQLLAWRSLLWLSYTHTHTHTHTHTSSLRRMFAGILAACYFCI